MKTLLLAWFILGSVLSVALAMEVTFTHQKLGGKVEAAIVDVDNLRKVLMLKYAGEFVELPLVEILESEQQQVVAFLEKDKVYQKLPSSMRQRCSRDRRMMNIIRLGGKEECEEAVLRSLDWLKKTQNRNGSWTHRHPVGITGMALLCYFAHCETPQSENYGETVEKAIIYLINAANANRGQLATDMNDRHWVYEHAFAAYALCEAYTFSTQMGWEVEGLKEATLSAVNRILKGQTEKGAWRYAFSHERSFDDSSLTCHCVEALVAAKQTGLEFENIDKVLKKAVEFLKFCQVKNGQLGYIGKQRPTNNLTGAGLLCFQIGGAGSSKEAKKALIHLKKNLTYEYGKADLYGHYYHGQAFMRAGAKEWKHYNVMFRDELLAAQKPDGSFKHSKLLADSRHYRTCMATLSLEVYYRFHAGSSAK